MDDSKIDEMRNLIIKIESIIGGHCYNSNIQNYTSGGRFESEGRWDKYPLNYRDKEFNKQKEHFISNSMSINEIRTSYYAFGANHLGIGRAIIKLMEHLEERYNIDLLELEKEYLAKKELKIDNRID
jgi:hypothetical protein